MTTQPSLPGLESWITEGKELHKRMNSDSWEIGDWLNAQDHTHKWKYAKEIFDGVSYEVLKEMEIVSKFYPKEDRAIGLSYRFYKIASLLKKPEAIKELKSAKNSGMRYADFRERVQILNAPMLADAGPKLPKPDYHPFEKLAGDIKRKFTSEPLDKWDRQKLETGLEDLRSLDPIREQMEARLNEI